MFRFFICFFILFFINGCSEKDTSAFSQHKHLQHLAGGDATITNTKPGAFSQPSSNIKDVDKIITFNLGDDFFLRPWVSKRASTSSRDGLGPHFNNNACQNCHVRDGRGNAPNVSADEDGTDFSSILFAASRSDIASEQRNLMLAGELAKVPDSTVGTQLQHRANMGIQAEVDLRVEYTTHTVTFADGHVVHLRRPNWIINNLYADKGFQFDKDTVFSARLSPPVIGMGLLQEIADADILSYADADDKNNDGISGKANRVWDATAKQVRIGRFGWKAGQPSVIQQAAGAFANDMGLSSRIFLGQICMPHQKDCLAAPNGNGDNNADYPYEVPDKVLDNINFYVSNLAVPARRNVDSKKVQRGQKLFNKAGCAACHVPYFKTQKSTANIEQSEQHIFPYTDLLLHDMGPDLADFTIDNKPANRAALVEYSANAHEWRTPPLWGLGLAKVVNPKANFLHDGRARTPMEAVLWHGGEAQASKEKVLEFSKKERLAFEAFLNDL